MPEWPIGHAWKACVRVTAPRVRIPPSPFFHTFNSVAPAVTHAAGGVCDRRSPLASLAPMGLCSANWRRTVLACRPIRPATSVESRCFLFAGTARNPTWATLCSISVGGAGAAGGGLAVVEPGVAAAAERAVGGVAGGFAAELEAAGEPSGDGGGPGGGSAERGARGALWFADVEGAYGGGVGAKSGAASAGPPALRPGAGVRAHGRPRKVECPHSSSILPRRPPVLEHALARASRASPSRACCNWSAAPDLRPGFGYEVHVAIRTPHASGGPDASRASPSRAWCDWSAAPDLRPGFGCEAHVAIRTPHASGGPDARGRSFNGSHVTPVP